MNAMHKEKVYEELRNYHVQKFPVIKSAEANNLRIEFGLIEDKIVGMILSLVNGRTEFVDATKELVDFQDKLKRIIPAYHEDDASTNVFISKIGRLGDIMILVKELGFKLTPARAIRI